MSIKAIILDVDGVIVGEKIGFNSPNPHPDVIEKLKFFEKKYKKKIIIWSCPPFLLDHRSQPPGHLCERN